MDVGIGLPATVPGVDGRTLVDWARESEQGGFSTLGVIDRLVYSNYEPMIALAAAAAVTERIRLTTSILITPIRPNAAELAKQAATLDHLSDGRLVLGVGLGGRGDDYEASGVEQKTRGAVLDAQLEEMKKVWDGEKRGFAGRIGPEPAKEGGPSVVVGGGVAAAFKRAAKFGDGWIMGGGSPDQFAEGAQATDEAWREAGRGGRPRKLALAYYSLGDKAREHADWYLGDYYGFLGEDLAGQIAGSAAVNEEMVKQSVEAFAEAGCDELIFFPSWPKLEQVELLADAAGLR